MTMMLFSLHGLVATDHPRHKAIPNEPCQDVGRFSRTLDRDLDHQHTDLIPHDGIGPRHVRNCRDTTVLAR